MATNYQIALTHDFWRQLHSLDQAIFKKWQRVGMQIEKNPFHPSLRSHPIHHHQDGMYAAELDDNYRIIFRHIKPDTVLLFWVDTHDAAYEKAARLTVTIEDGKVKILDTDKASTSTQQFVYSRPKHGLLFARWSDDELINVGLDPRFLPSFREMDSLNDFQKAEGIVPANVFDALFELILNAEEIKEGAQASDSELKAALARPERREDIYLFEDSEEFARALSGSLAEWMLFLHPLQRQIVEATFNGPARIKGGAGTGKTVVALHRARYLARALKDRSDGKVLFVAFNKSLVSVIGGLLDRLCTSEERLRIDVKTLHSWCSSLLAASGVSFDVVDTKKNASGQFVRDALLDDAIAQAKSEFPTAKVWALPRNFIDDEIRHVIKGRAISTLEEYLQLRRTGRGTPLSADERQAVFRVYEHYQSGLNGMCDFDDMILMALRKASEGAGVGAYAHIIVDEVQDFSEAALRLVNTIAGSGENKLLLIGDGQQKIYKGGFSLKSIGISVVGRSRVLRQNYRNTYEILQAAYSLMRNAKRVDFEDDGDEPSEPVALSRRHGPRPQFKDFRSYEEEVAWVAASIRRLVSAGTYKAGDIAILYLSPRIYGGLIDDQLRKNGLEAIELRGNDAIGLFDEDKVKRCTFHSAKGMEFKAVFLVGVTDGTLPRTHNLTGELLEDEIERARRLLFVAMTRARDQLFMTSAKGAPSRFIAEIDPALLEQG